MSGTQEALYRFGELRRELVIINRLTDRLDVAMGRLLSPRQGVATQENLSDWEIWMSTSRECAQAIGQHLVSAGAELGRIERCLANAAAIRRSV